MNTILEDVMKFNQDMAVLLNKMKMEGYSLLYDETTDKPDALTIGFYTDNATPHVIRLVALQVRGVPRPGHYSLSISFPEIDTFGLRDLRYLRNFMWKGDEEGLSRFLRYAKRLATTLQREKIPLGILLIRFPSPFRGVKVTTMKVVTCDSIMAIPAIVSETGKYLLVRDDFLESAKGDRYPVYNRYTFGKALMTLIKDK